MSNVYNSFNFANEINCRFPYLYDKLSYAYGDNYVAAKYCGFSKTPKKINGEWQHGHIVPERNFNPELVIGSDGLSKFRKEKKYYVARQDQVNYLYKEGFKNVIPIGLPIIYLNKPREKRILNSLLIMPGHSLSGIDYQAEEEKFINRIKYLFPTFDLVVCCLHMNDFEKNIWVKAMEKEGIATIVGANENDSNTYFRLASLFSQMEYLLTDSFGSHVAYASYFGCKVSIIENDYISSDIKLKNWNKLKAFAPFYINNPNFKYSFIKRLDEEIKEKYSFFYCPLREAKYQIEWAYFQIGADNIRSPADLKLIFGWENMLVKFFKIKFSMLSMKLTSFFKYNFFDFIKMRIKLHKELKIFTHLTFDEKILIYKISKKLPKNAICAEIGSYFGASSSIIASNLKNEAKLYCIDTWGNHGMIYNEDDLNNERLKEKDTLTDFRKNTFKFKSKIIEMRGWSNSKIIELKQLEDRLDFLFIDGDHNYDSVKLDWDLYSDLLLPGSIVAFHDTGWADGVIKVINDDVLKKAVLLNKLPNLQIFRIK